MLGFCCSSHASTSQVRYRTRWPSFMYCGPRPSTRYCMIVEIAMPRYSASSLVVISLSIIAFAPLFYFAKRKIKPRKEKIAVVTAGNSEDFQDLENAGKSVKRICLQIARAEGIIAQKITRCPRVKSRFRIASFHRF